MSSQPERYSKKINRAFGLAQAAATLERRMVMQSKTPVFYLNTAAATIDEIRKCIKQTAGESSFVWECIKAAFRDQ